MFKEENVSYFSIGAMLAFLISIISIGVYDGGMYPGFVYLQSVLGLIFAGLLIVVLIIKIAKMARKKRKLKTYPKKYVASSKTKIYHKAGCKAVDKLDDKNKEFGPTITKFKNKKYKPCDLCMVE